MVEDDNFVEKVELRWEELRNGIFSTDNIISVIDEKALWLDEAQERNFEKWPILGLYIWPNPAPFPKTYAEEISNMKAWITDRLEWIDANINSL